MIVAWTEFELLVGATSLLRCVSKVSLVRHTFDGERVMPQIRTLGILERPTRQKDEQVEKWHRPLNLPPCGPAVAVFVGRDEFDLGVTPLRFTDHMPVTELNRAHPRFRRCMFEGMWTFFEGKEDIGTR